LSIDGISLIKAARFHESCGFFGCHIALTLTALNNDYALYIVSRLRCMSEQRALFFVRKVGHVLHFARKAVISLTIFAHRSL